MQRLGATTWLKGSDMLCIRGVMTWSRGMYSCALRGEASVWCMYMYRVIGSLVDQEYPASLVRGAYVSSGYSSTDI